MTGRISKLMPDRSFGFIAGDDRLSYFFHATCVRDVAFRYLTENQMVEFDRDVDTGKGPRAMNVRPYEARQ